MLIPTAFPQRNCTTFCNTFQSFTDHKYCCIHQPICLYKRSSRSNPPRSNAYCSTNRSQWTAPSFRSTITNRIKSVRDDRFSKAASQIPEETQVMSDPGLSGNSEVSTAFSSVRVQEANNGIENKLIFVQVLTLPTILTLARVLAVPLLVAVWFGKEDSAASWTACIFLIACVTDFLDGFLARKMGTFSAFGAFLDPVADKLMVSTVLILVSSKPIMAGPLAGNSWLIPVLASAIIGREIAMSSLREWAASVGEEAYRAVAVSQLGKWKTTTQMVALTLVLFSSTTVENSFVDVSATVGPPLLGLAAFLTLYSLYEYIRGLWKFLF